MEAEGRSVAIKIQPSSSLFYIHMAYHGMLLGCLGLFCLFLICFLGGGRGEGGYSLQYTPWSLESCWKPIITDRTQLCFRDCCFAVSSPEYIMSYF